MKQNLVSLFIIIICLLALNQVVGSDDAFPLIFGVTLLLSFMLGEFFSKAGFPRISTYLIVGVITGPYVLGFFSVNSVESLKVIDSIALSTIAFVAGSEISFKEGGRFLKIVKFSTIQFLIGFVLTFAFLYITGKFLGVSVYENTVFMLFLALILNAVSPATTVAVIKETNSKGKLTEYVLSTAILKDFFIIIFFSLFLSFLGDKSSEASVLKVLLEELLSVAAGLVTGIFVYLYIKFVKLNTGIFLFLIIVIVTWFAKELHLSNLMVFITAGVFLRNSTLFGNVVTDTIDKNFNIILLIFFLSAGMVIDVKALSAMLLIAGFLVLIRFGVLYISTFISGVFLKEDYRIKHWSFMGFIGQAGVSIGFAKIIASIFPFGDTFQTLVLAIVAINQIAGPVLFRFALKRCKEIK